MNLNNIVNIIRKTDQGSQSKECPISKESERIIRKSNIEEGIKKYLEDYLVESFEQDYMWKHHYFYFSSYDITTECLRIPVLQRFIKNIKKNDIDPKTQWKFSRIRLKTGLAIDNEVKKIIKEFFSKNYGLTCADDYEINVRDKIGIKVKLDLLLDLNNGMFSIIELKSVGQDKFEKVDPSYMNQLMLYGILFEKFESKKLYRKLMLINWLDTCKNFAVFTIFYDEKIGLNLLKRYKLILESIINHKLPGKNLNSCRFCMFKKYCEKEYNIFDEFDKTKLETYLKNINLILNKAHESFELKEPEVPSPNQPEQDFLSKPEKQDQEEPKKESKQTGILSGNEGLFPTDRIIIFGDDDLNKIKY